MEKVVEFLKGKEARRFYWNVLNGFIGLAVIYLSGVDWLYTPVVIGILNGISKEINKRYF